MSSGPCSEGVTQVLDVLAKIEFLAVETKRLREQAVQIATRLNVAENDLQNSRIVFNKMLEDMDLKSPGNIGYDERLSWFVAEMGRQLASRSKVSVGVDPNSDEMPF